MSSGRIRSRDAAAVRREIGMAPDTIVEEWDQTHPRWDDLVACVRHESSPEQPQEQWAFVSHPLGTPGLHFLVALRGDTIAGFLKFVEQPIGPPDGRPPVLRAGVPLTEAKITAFGVRLEFRRLGIGRALQEAALRRAAEVGCFQARSHSSFGNQANYALKMALGFAVVPDFRAPEPDGVFWVKHVGAP